MALPVQPVHGTKKRLPLLITGGYGASVNTPVDNISYCLNMSGAGATRQYCINVGMPQMGIIHEWCPSAA